MFRIHDVDHPGVSNNFLVNTGYKNMALLYNDRSVLENHHLHVGFSTLAESGCGFTDSLSKADYKAFRDGVIEMVLATDLAQHFQVISSFKNKAQNAVSFNSRDDRILLLKMFLKCADVSNPTKEWTLYNKWASNVLEEFFRQGDRERDLSIPISPFCDRVNTSTASSQIGFINFICLPSFEALDTFLCIPEILDNLKRNKKKWTEISEASAAETAALQPKLLKSDKDLTLAVTE